MCRNTNAFRAIDRAKRDAANVWALYETRDNVDDLVAIIEVMDNVVKLLNVHNDGSTSNWGTAPYDFRVSVDTVLIRFNVCRRDELKFYRPFYRLLAC